jgi:hypothetical protein
LGLGRAEALMAPLSIWLARACLARLAHGELCGR